MMRCGVPVSLAVPFRSCACGVAGLRRSRGVTSEGENAMPAFRFVYEIKSGIELRAEIEARLFVDAARELYDECGHMLQYVNLQDMTIERYGSEPGDLRYEYHRSYPCPECGVWYGEGCEVCHGLGYTAAPLEVAQ